MIDLERATRRLVFVDCEADGPCPGKGRLTEFGAVAYATNATFHGIWEKGDRVSPVLRRFVDWLRENVEGQPVFVSDNPAFDWQWMNFYFHHLLGDNPFGFSARRIGDFYAGLTGDFHNSTKWKRLRVTKHTHHPVDDAMGNVEAFRRMLAGER